MNYSLTPQNGQAGVDNANALLAAIKQQVTTNPSLGTQKVNPDGTFYDNNIDLAKSAGTAGLGLSDLSSLLKPDTNSIKDKSAQQMGYESYNDFINQVYAKSTQSTQQFYQDAYNAAGLGDLLNKITTSKNKLAEATGQVNDNPWLSEASRVGKIRNLSDMANAEISNWQNAYDTGLGQVNNLVQMHATDMTNDQALNEKKLALLQKVIEDKTSQAQAAALSKYLPDYLTGKQSSEAPKTVSVPDGTATYQWDPVQQKYVLLANNPKSTSGTVAPGENPQLYTGLSSVTATAVRGKVSAFKTEATVQNFATIQDGYNFANSIANNTKNPADDQALIYSLAKALDPGSVVREGEYATAQKYAQSWVKAYGKGVEQALMGTGFLSETARANIKKTIQQKFEASKKSYENLYNQYSEGINKLTGRKDGSSFIQDYRIDTSSDIQAPDLQSLRNKYGY